MSTGTRIEQIILREIRIRLKAPVSLHRCWIRFAASQHYWAENIIELEVKVTSAGTIPAPESIGLGYEVKTKVIEGLTARSNVWKDRARISA